MIIYLPTPKLVNFLNITEKYNYCLSVFKSLKILVRLNRILVSLITTKLRNWFWQRSDFMSILFTIQFKWSHSGHMVARQSDSGQLGPSCKCNQELCAKSSSSPENGIVWWECWSKVDANNEKKNSSETTFQTAPHGWRPTLNLP